MGNRRKETKADLLLNLRVRRRTLRRYQRCRELLTALEGSATGDAMLAEAFDLLARRLRHHLDKRGIPLPPVGGVKVPESPKFVGVPPLHVSYICEG